MFKFRENEWFKLWKKNFEIKSNKGKEIIKDIFNTGIIIKKSKNDNDNVNSRD